MLHPQTPAATTFFSHASVRHKGSTAARYDMNSVGRMARFRALSRTPLRCCVFPSLDSLVGRRPSARRNREGCGNPGLVFCDPSIYGLRGRDAIQLTSALTRGVDLAKTSSWRRSPVSRGRPHASSQPLCVAPQAGALLSPCGPQIVRPRRMRIGLVTSAVDLIGSEQSVNNFVPNTREHRLSRVR
jgi:hypothetical protein